MFNWVDILIATWILYSIIIGLKSGLVSTLFDFFGFIVAFIVAKFYAHPIMTWMETNSSAFAKFKGNLFNDIVSSTGGGSPTSNLSNAASGFVFPDNIEGQIMKAFFNGANSKPIQAQSERFTESILNMSTFIMVLVLMLVVIAVLKLVLNQFAKLPLLKEVNHLTGGLIGALKGFVGVSVLFALVVFISPMLSKTGLINAIQGSYLGGFFYNDNVIIYLISWLQK